MLAVPDQQSPLVVVWLRLRLPLGDMVRQSTIAAVYTFAAHYHSGQWSRGYRLLCAADRAWRRKTGLRPRLGYWERLIQQETDTEVSSMYRRLENNYREAM